MIGEMIVTRQTNRAIEPAFWARSLSKIVFSNMRCRLTLGSHQRGAPRVRSKLRRWRVWNQGTRHDSIDDGRLRASHLSACSFVVLVADDALSRRRCTCTCGESIGASAPVRNRTRGWRLSLDSRGNGSGQSTCGCTPTQPPSGWPITCLGSRTVWARGHASHSPKPTSSTLKAWAACSSWHQRCRTPLHT